MYLSQLNSRTQGVGESLQELATAVEQLAHCANPPILEDHIRREAHKTFADGVENHKNSAITGRENSERGSQAQP
jgi:hypothetical protein